MFRDRWLNSLLFPLFTIALFFSDGALATAADSDDLAKYLCESTGVPRGICAIPRAGDGSLAMSLARSGLLVHAMVSNAGNLTNLREQAATAGFLCSKLYAEEGSPSIIPFADSYVNLLVVSDATDANISALSTTEIQRVLVYGVGKAVVGLSAGSPGPLTKAKLELWLKGFADASSRIVQDAHGLWAIITRNPQPGAAPWTHRLYSPANNVVSTDTACTWPLMTQWLGSPLLAMEPLILVANDRMAIVRLDYGGYSAWLDMLDAHNGTLLWRRDQPDSSVATRTSAMALTADSLYLAEGSDVLILDPATGKEIKRVDCHELGGQVKWLAVEDGDLYVMAGSKEPRIQSHQTWVGWGAIPPNFAKCSGIGAYNIAAQRWLWHIDEPVDSLNQCTVGLFHGRLYYFVAGSSLTCCDGKTGKPIWKNPSIVKKINEFNGVKLAEIIPRSHVGAIICTDKYVAIHKPYYGTVIASAANGEMLWSSKFNDIAFVKDVLIRKGGDGPSTFLDAGTGNPIPDVWPQFQSGGGCGQFTMTPNLLCGQAGVSYDLKTEKLLSDAGGGGPVCHKAPCLSGSFVGEGLNVSGGVTCKCAYGVRGAVVLANAPTPISLPKKAPDQLVRARTPAAVAPFPVSAADWPTFRANNERGNANVARVPDKVTLAWDWPHVQVSAPSAALPPPDPCGSDKMPVQASAVGALVFIPGSDGQVTALDLTTGALKWRFTTLRAADCC